MTVAPTSVRERLLDAAADVFADVGWRKLTMGKVADRAGVSRQTAYNEFQTKPGMAHELVMRELAGFLDVVSTRIEASEDPIEGIRAAVSGALTMARSNPLLTAVLNSAHDGDSELVPYITQSQALIEVAAQTVAANVRSRFRDLPLTDPELQIASDAIVRVVLSHVMQPSKSPDQVADELAWIVAKVVEQ